MIGKKAIQLCLKRLRLSNWQVRVKINSELPVESRRCPKLVTKARVCPNWHEHRATIEFREEFPEALQANLLWHELGHLVMGDIDKFLVQSLTQTEFKYYKELAERAINQFANALEADE